MKLFLPRLNKLQIDRCSEFMANLALVLFASMVVPVFIGQNVELNVIFSGFVSSIGFLIISLLILRT